MQVDVDETQMQNAILGGIDAYFPPAPGYLKEGDELPDLSRSETEYVGTFLHLKEETVKTLLTAYQAQNDDLEGAYVRVTDAQLEKCTCSRDQMTSSCAGQTCKECRTKGAVLDYYFRERLRLYARTERAVVAEEAWVDRPAIRRHMLAAFSTDEYGLYNEFYFRVNTERKRKAEASKKKPKKPVSEATRKWMEAQGVKPRAVTLVRAVVAAGVRTDDRVLHGRHEKLDGGFQRQWMEQILEEQAYAMRILIHLDDFADELEELQEANRERGYTAPFSREAEERWKKFVAEEAAKAKDLGHTFDEKEVTLTKPGGQKQSLMPPPPERIKQFFEFVPLCFDSKIESLTRAITEDSFDELKRKGDEVGFLHMIVGIQALGTDGFLNNKANANKYYEQSEDIGMLIPPCRRGQHEDASPFLQLVHYVSLCIRGMHTEQLECNVEWFQGAIGKVADLADYLNASFVPSTQEEAYALSERAMNDTTHLPIKKAILNMTKVLLELGYNSLWNQYSEEDVAQIEHIQDYSIELEHWLGEVYASIIKVVTRDDNALVLTQFEDDFQDGFPITLGKYVESKLHWLEASSIANDGDTPKVGLYNEIKQMATFAMLADEPWDKNVFKLVPNLKLFPGYPVSYVPSSKARFVLYTEVDVYTVSFSGWDYFAYQADTIWAKLQNRNRKSRLATNGGSGDDTELNLDMLDFAWVVKLIGSMYAQTGTEGSDVARKMEKNTAEQIECWPADERPLLTRICKLFCKLFEESAKSFHCEGAMALRQACVELFGVLAQYEPSLLLVQLQHIRGIAHRPAGEVIIAWLNDWPQGHDYSDPHSKAAVRLFSKLATQLMRKRAAVLLHFDCFSEEADVLDQAAVDEMDGSEATRKFEDAVAEFLTDPDERPSIDPDVEFPGLQYHARASDFDIIRVSPTNSAIAFGGGRKGAGAGVGADDDAMDGGQVLPQRSVSRYSLAVLVVLKPGIEGTAEKAEELEKACENEAQLGAEIPFYGRNGSARSFCLQPKQTSTTEVGWARLAAVKFKNRTSSSSGTIARKEKEMASVAESFVSTISNEMLRLAHLGLRIPTQKTNDGFELQVLDILMVCIDTHDLGTLQMATVSVLQHGASRIQEYEISPGKALLAQKWTELLIKAVDETMEATELSAMQRTRLVDELAHTQHGKSAIQGLVECLMLKGKQESFFADDDIVVDKLVNKAAKLLTKLAHFTKVCGTLKQLMVNETTGSAGSNLISKISICLNERQTEGVGTELRWQILLLISTLLQTDFSLGLKLGILPRDNQNAGNETGDALKEVKKVLSDDCECNLECFKVSPKKIYAALKVTLMLQENDAWRLVLKLLDPECWKVLCKPLFPAPFAIGEGFDFQAMDKDMLEQRWCDQVFVHSTVLMLLSNELLASAIGVDPDDADSYGRGSIGGGGADGGVGAATSEKLTLTIGYNGFAPTDTEDFKPNQKLKDLKDIMRKEGTRGAHGDSVVVNGLVLTDDDETIERICLRLRLWDPKLKKVTSEFHWVARKDFKVICDTILNAENAGAPAATAPTQPLALVAPGAVAAAPGGFGGAPAAPAATAPDVFSMESFVSIFGIDAKGDPVVRWTRASLNARQELISSWCSFIGLGTDPQIRRSCGFDQCNKTTLSWIYAVALALGKPAVGSGRVPNPSGPTLSLTIVRDDCPAPVQTGNPKLPAYRMKVRATLTDTVQQFCNAEITPLFNGTRAGENAGEYRLVFGGYPLDMTSTIDEIRQVGVRDGCELRWVPNGLCREIDLAMRHVPVGMCEEVDYGQEDEEDGVDSSNTVDLFARSAHATRVLSLSNLLLVLLSRVTETQRSHSTVSAQIASKKETLKALTQELAMPELDPSNEGDLKAQKAAAEESLTTLAGKLDSIDAIHDAADMVYCITTIFSCITGSIRTMLGQRDRNGDGVEINKVCQTLFQCTILLLKFAQHFKEQKLDVAAARVSGTPGSADSDESLLQTRFASLVQQECALMVPVLWNALDDTLRFHPDAEMEAAAASGSAKDSVDMTQKSILILLEFLMQRWFLKNGGEDDGAGSESYINPAVEHTLSRNGLVEIILSRLAACMAKKESLPFVRGTLHFFTSVMMKWFEPSVLDTPSDRLSSSTRHRATAVGLARAMLRSARGSNGVFSCLTEGTKRLYTNSSRGLFGAGSSWASGGDWAEAWRSSLDLAAAGLRALGHFGHIVDDSIQFFAVHCRRFVQLMEHLNPNPATSAANLADMPPIRPGSDFRSDLQELVSMLRFVAELSRFSAWPEQLPAIKSRTRGGGMADAAAYEGAGFVLRVARIFKWAADFMKTVDDAIEVETQRESNDRESRSTRTHLHQVQQAVQAAVACCLTILKNASMEKPLQSSLIVEDLTASMTLFQLEHKDAEKNFLREVESSRPSYATLKKVMEIAARDSHKHADADFPAAPTSLRVKKGEADFVLEHATMLMVSQARRVLRTWAEKIQFARNPVEKSAMEKDLEGYKKRLSDYLNVDIREVVARTLPMDQHRGSMGGRMSSMSGMSHLSRRTSSLSIFSSTSSRQGGGSADAYSYNSSHIPSPSTKFFEAVLTAFCEDMLSPTPVAVE